MISKVDEIKHLKKFFGDYFFILIYSYESYENIDENLNKAKNQDICIIQYEEDWFNKTDWTTVRNAIKDHPNWTENSFIITNSYRDFLETQKYVKCIWRPALCDLMVYNNRIDNKFTTSNVDKYTGMLLTRIDPPRERSVQYLLDHREKLSVLKYGNEVFVPNHNVTLHIDREGPIDSPYGATDIFSDEHWIGNSAFVLTIETHWKSFLFAPTLSEKTFRSMYFYRPALIYGGAGVRDDLLRLGFDTWDWFIDWSYDSIYDDEIRFEKFLEELNRLMNTDINELINTIETNKHRLIHNREQIDRIIENYSRFEYENF